jgi:hypothetical protein
LHWRLPGDRIDKPMQLRPLVNAGIEKTAGKAVFEVEVTSLTIAKVVRKLLIYKEIINRCLRCHAGLSHTLWQCSRQDR